MLDYQKERSPSRRSGEENVDTRGSTLVLKESIKWNVYHNTTDGKATTKKFVASVFNMVM